MKKASNRVEMVGEIYNSWSVIRYVETVNKIAKYECECIECLNVYIVDGRNIRSGLSKRCTNCGLRKSNANKIGKSKTKKTIKELAEHYLLKAKKWDAKRRKQFWNLSLEQFKSLIYQACYYCNQAPNTTVNPTKGHSLASARATDCFITYNGIDRVDSAKGYLPDNVVTCCEWCNKAKLDRSSEDFLNWAKQLINHQNLPK